MTFIVPTKQVAIMFILMAVGWLCYKIKFIHAQTAKDLTKVLLYIVSPCLIIQSFNQRFTYARLIEFGLLFVLIALLFIFKIVLSAVIFNQKVIVDKQKRTILRYSGTYTNAGFMGVPLVQAILGSNGVFYAVPYLIVYNIFMWTHGISMFQDKHNSFGQQVRQAVLNPNIIAAVIGMILFVTQFKIPDLLATPMNYISDINTPLSMIVIGTNLGSINLKDDWHDYLAWSGVLVRNIVFPLLVLGILVLIPLSYTAKITTLIMAACPVAGVVVLFSLISNYDVKFPTKLMCLSTLSAVVTIPLIIFLATVIHL
ncbi:MAG: AEC family transporter [Lactobacillus sp.]